MARLITQGDRYFKEVAPGKWQELSEGQFRQESYYQTQIQGQSVGEKMITGAGQYIRNTLSGASELLGGDQNAYQQQQNRAEWAQEAAPHEQYGGIPYQAGQFMAPMGTAVIPGGLPAQMGIGAAQGAAENPDAPWMGAGFGAGMTWAGDWLAQSLGRVTRTLTNKRQALSPDITAKLDAAEQYGLEFTPGQRMDDPAARRMEMQLMKNPRFAQLDQDRFLTNQANLNDAAAETLGLTPTGRLTGPMRGEAARAVGEAFDSVAGSSEPITLLGRPWVDAAQDLTDAGQAHMERFIRKFPTLFEGEPITGQQWVQARNWLAKQSRLKSNIQSGVSEEMEPFMAILDDSLESANLQTNPGLINRITDARKKWKALLVIEDAQKRAGAAAGGNIPADQAYQALKRYDKGGIFRGKQGDKFSTIVDAMAAARDVEMPPMPSQDMGAGGALRGLAGALWNAPAAEMYMRGSNIGRMMLGQFDELQPGSVEGLRALGIGTARGLMADDDLE